MGIENLEIKNPFEKFKKQQDDVMSALVKGINYEKIKEDFDLRNPLESFENTNKTMSEGNRELRRRKQKRGNSELKRM